MLLKSERLLRESVIATNLHSTALQEAALAADAKLAVVQKRIRDVLFELEARYACQKSLAKEPYGTNKRPMHAKRALQNSLMQRKRDLSLTHTQADTHTHILEGGVHGLSRTHKHTSEGRWEAAH